MEQTIVVKIAIMVFAIAMMVILLDFCDLLGGMLKNDRAEHESFDRELQDGLRSALGGFGIAAYTSANGGTGR